MVRSRGPIGLLEESLVMGRGVLARTDLSNASPIGLLVGPGILMQVKSTLTKSKASRMGILVHSQSQISAEEWVQKIKASNSIPDHYQAQIKWKQRTVYVTNPKRFRIPNDVIKKEWVNDWLSAFTNTDWEITTGCLDFVVEKGTSSLPDITITHNPDLSNGELVDGYTKSTMTQKSHHTHSLSIERGNTLPTGVSLKSGRKAILIANRIALKLGNLVKTFKFTDEELVEVWFHEIAAHAGRNSQGLSDTHGDKTVDRYGRDIRDMFGKTTTVPKLLLEVEKYLR